MIKNLMIGAAALTLSLGFSGTGTTGAAHASLLVAKGLLDPCAEVLSPPGGAGSGPACGVSTESGTFNISYDTITKLLTIAFEYTGLTDAFTTWHIHGPADADSVAGAMLEGPVVFPLADEDGTPSAADENPFHASITMSDVLLGAFGETLASFEAALKADLLYLNIHSALPDGFPLGELRGQLLFVDVPEPASMTLLGAGIMGLGYMARRRKA
jgi:hypothetical protein